MRIGKKQRERLISWLFVGAVVVLSVSLGLLQYRWIGEVSRAERERLRGTLQMSLNRLSQDFNSELTTACLALLPERPPLDAEVRHREYATRFAQWTESNRHGRLFRSLSVVVPSGNSMELLRFDAAKAAMVKTDWPPELAEFHERAMARLIPDSRGGRGGGGRRGSPVEDSANLIEIPVLEQRPERDGPPNPHDTEWLIVEVNVDYLTSTIVPQLLQRHLGGAGTNDYQAEIVTRGKGAAVPVYSSDGANRPGIGDKADASVRLFDLRMDMMFRRFGRGRGGSELRGGGGAGRGQNPDFPPFDRGRWVMSVRHHAGSLEAVVERARERNLAVTTGILILMMAAVWALVRYTRRAQQLADLQMEFVAGVSHELRTPLSVMRTAGHNLKGRVSNDPLRVQRYGALIEEQSEKLGDIVEQVLRFANAQVDRVIGPKEAVSVEGLIEDALAADRQLIEESHCVIEKNITPGLPPVMADPNSLKHAIQNLISNAAKYGKGGDWIGISAAVEPDGAPAVEIRIADHGPGIPSDEMNQIFEPFYRGKKAIADQIHGTGLGLSLARRIVEAHHGTVTVRSEEGKGTEFLVRIPAATVEREHELANSVDRG